MRKRIVSAAVLLALAAACVMVSVFPAAAADPVYTYEDMERDLKKIAEEHKDLTELKSLAKTADGREVYSLRVGAESAEHNVLIFGAIHAREYITAELVMRLTEDYVEAAAKGEGSYKGVPVKSLTENTAVYFLPMVNPDGVTISQSGLDRIESADVRKRIYQIYEMDGAVEIDPYLVMWKSNASGVDLNRQFDAMWESYNDKVGHPSADHYKGTAPGTEPEAKALIDLTEEVGFERTISYHTQGNVIYWYFGQKGELLNRTKRFAEAVSALTGYKMDANYESLDPAGYKDWAISKKGIPSLTIEVGSNGHPVPHSQIEEMYRKNKNVVFETILSALEDK